MARRIKPLFENKTIERFCNNVELTDKQKESAKKWLELLEKDQLKDERVNYPKFQQLILQDVLGYELEQIDFETDNIEFQIKNTDGKKILGIEAKGTGKDLFAHQYYGKKEQEKPILQLATYMFTNVLDYGICTNYNEFIFVMKEHGLNKLHSFKFESIKNNEIKLKEFIGIFGKERILQKDYHKQLHKESVEVDEQLTKEFYDLFHQTRLMLIEEFKQNPEVRKDEAIHYAQLYLNRLIFIFFVEDHSFIYNRTFSEQISLVLKPELIGDDTRLVCQRVNTLFTWLNKGSKIPDIFGFNGGLFQEEIPSKFFFSDLRKSDFFLEITNKIKIPKKVKLNEYARDIVKKIGNNLNPIISNLMLMNSYDFTSQVNVEILGHIFEQSISDLEALRTETVSKRKEDGIYYTPEFVTDYICRNTIIPYLSKTGATTVEVLVREYSQNIKELENKLNDIKILDPACGSGAFLVKAVDILLDIHNEIQSYKPTYIALGTQLTEYVEEDQVKRIIESCIFGVDINEESVEITKLSLFLKLANSNRKLIGLTKNIKIGNSIINDKNIDLRSFDWNKEFAEVMHEKYGGFDVIIGNPPYIPIEFMNENEKKYYSNNFKGIYRKYDSAVLFVEKFLKLTRNGGYLSFIIPLTWQTGDNYPQFRRLLFHEMKTSLLNIVNLPFDIFPDAYVDTGIVTFKKSVNPIFYGYQYDKNAKINHVDVTLGEQIPFELVLQHPDLKVYASKMTYETDSTNRKNSVTLGTITDSTQGIVTSKYPISSTKKSEKFIPFLLKAEANRYRFQIKETAFIDSTSIPKILHLYTQPKIMIRRIVNRQNRLMAFYEDTGIVTNKDYNPFIVTSEDYDLFYLLGLLNSKYFSYQYVTKSSLALKDDFRQTTLSELRKLPIRSDKTKQKDISDKAKRLTKLCNDFFENRDKIFRRITDNFNIKISKKLTNLLDLNFSDFKREIEQLVKRKLTLEEQDEWEKYFTNNKSPLKIQRDEIISLDEQIDSDVYALYNVSEKEQKLVDEKILKMII